MLKLEQIPDEVVEELFAHAHFLGGRSDARRAAAAMLAAWPGVDYRPGSKVTKTWRDPGKIILPLPTEKSDGE